MKRRPRIVKLCVFLFAGAIVNVAVAWGAAPRSCEQRLAWQRASARESMIDTHVYPGEIRRTDWNWFHESGFRLPPERDLGVMIYRSAFLSEIAYGTDTWLYERAVSRLWFGFPCQSMYAEDSVHWGMLQTTINQASVVFLHDPTALVVSFTQPATPLRSSSFRDYCIFPLKPLWPGFAINTVFYAAVLWVLFAAPGWIRRRIRARRGLCPACAYPIGTNPVCTECGQTLPKRTIEA